MYLRIRDELGSIMEYYQSKDHCQSGSLIKSLINRDRVESGRFYRIEFVNSEGDIIVDEKLGTRLSPHEYLVLVPTKFLWFKKVRYKRLQCKAKLKDKVLIRLINKKYMILTVESVTSLGITAVSDDFSKQIRHEEYEVLRRAEPLPIRIDPYYLTDYPPNQGDYIEVINVSKSYGTKDNYPAIYRVLDVKGSVIYTETNELDSSECKVIEFTGERYTQVYRVTQLEVQESSDMINLPEIALIDLVNRVESLEHIIDDFFGRMVASPYYRRQKNND